MALLTVTAMPSQRRPAPLSPLEVTVAPKPRNQPSRYRRTVLIQTDQPLTDQQSNDLYQLLVNHRTELELNSANEGARLLLLEVIVQAVIDLMNPGSTERHRSEALAFFHGPLYRIYLNMLGLTNMGFPQAIECLLLNYSRRS